MKILYVEDELRKHKHKIKSLFEPLLTRKIIREFEQLLLDKRATAQQIQKLLNSSNTLVVARTFPEAMQLLLENMDEFALFIIDRNLSENNEYDTESTSKDQYFDAIKEVYPVYTEDLHLKYALEHREGDYILEYLLSKNIDCKERFFMLTANSDRLRNEEYISEKIHFAKFAEENIISKDDMENEQRLQKIIISKDEVMIRAEHPEIFLLEKFPEINKKHASVVMEILLDLKQHPDMNSTRIKSNFGALRIVITGLLNDINNITDLKYHNSKDKVTERNKINWLNGNKKTAVLQPYCDYVYTLTSELSLHEEDDLSKTEKTKSYNEQGLPTIHTLNSAICAIKDIFYWVARQLDSI
jgi:hypothetical protein